MKTRWFLLVAGLLLLPVNLWAHAGHEATMGGSSGFSSGLLHPWGGLDHLLAMLAVGLWAAQLRGRAIWLVPLSFLVAMAVGGWLGQAGWGVPFVEQGIAASVFLLGLAIAFAVRLPWGVPAVLVAAFALFHGSAHGAEIPAGAMWLGYAGGFLISTALLHALGLGLGLVLGRLAPAVVLRGLGGAVACVGLTLLIF